MGDGHTGQDNREVNKRQTQFFELVLSCLEIADGRGDFVIHATTRKQNGQPIAVQYGLSDRDFTPQVFLTGFGFSRHNGSCPFHGDDCYYRTTASFGMINPGSPRDAQVASLVNTFSRLAEKIDGLFSTRNQESAILKEVEIDESGRIVFGPPAAIDVLTLDAPEWVEEAKFNRLRELESQQSSLKAQIDDMTAFLPLVYATGDLLEDSVVKALRWLGLEADKTPPGDNIDILARTADGSKRFGFEITGLADAIKKNNSRKLVQVLGFDLEKEDGEKGILIANTYNTTPVSKRTNLPNFSPPILSFVQHHPILLMTAWNLYCMVGDVLDEKRTREEVIDLLYTATGELRYPPSD